MTEDQWVARQATRGVDEDHARKQWRDAVSAPPIGERAVAQLATLLVPAGAR